MADDQPLTEALSAYAHDAWSGWWLYAFSKGTVNDDGTLTFPAWAVERWTRQMQTKYADLSDQEKESDRAEAAKMIAIVKAHT